MKIFWIYVTFATLAIWSAATSENPSESYNWSVGLLGLVGCFPWSFLLGLVGLIPNGQFTLTNVSAMSAINALLIYSICRSKQRQIGWLYYISLCFGGFMAKFRK